MIISMPGAALTGIALVLVYRAGYRGFWVVVLAALFGFFVSSTGVAPDVQSCINFCARLISQICTTLFH